MIFAASFSYDFAQRRLLAPARDADYDQLPMPFSAPVYYTRSGRDDDFASPSHRLRRFSRRVLRW